MGSPRVEFEWAARVRRASDALAGLSDADLRRRFDDCRDVLSGSWPPHSSEQLAGVFVLVDQAVQRTLGMRLHDVQLVAGQVLARGRIAEMQTGEGKTIVAALGAASLAAAGRSVHVMTANTYLAGRDCQLLRPLFELLGLRAAELPEKPDPAAKRAAYACDIVYGTGYEFGFDYLRDELERRRMHAVPLGERMLQALGSRGPAESVSSRAREECVIVDEADHVLLDEASSALILSETPPGPCLDAPAHLAARDFAPWLERDVHFVIEEATEQIHLTSAGFDRIHASSVSIPQGVLVRPWAVYIEQALRARWLLLRDVHYVVRGGHVCIVHEATGRILQSHLWQDGLHQGVEAKENCDLTAGSHVAARISRQRYFQRYRFACGMTGTATGVSEAEFRELSRLEVTEVPRRLPSRRALLPTRFFVDQTSKWSAIAEDLVDRHHSGQPVLVGTRTIAASEVLVALLRTHGIPCAVLNGKQDAEESDIVALAGRKGAVTVATNMAGRGTDIRLGEGVRELGGLHVVLSEPQESTRVDRQLIGRCARQDDPGSAQMFCALDDHLVARAAPWWADRWRERASDGEIAADLSHEVRKLQEQAERAAFRLRRLLFESETERDRVVARLHGGAHPADSNR